ncbi:hypothetical protein [Nonomuraea sp. KM90]|uniref:hypothetical protein n=1 Tax=Nonomuraea sp. KM90 TaxID=3457428 RepID=UPI003FCD84FD
MSISVDGRTRACCGGPPHLHEPIEKTVWSWQLWFHGSALPIPAWPVSSPPVQSAITA